MFNLVFLKTFVLLSKTNSFRATARANAITQSAVSQQIRSLENKIGCRLVERSGKNIHLTHSGEIFLKYAEKILGHYDEALLQIKSDTLEMSGTIKIGTIYSIGLYRLQPLIRKFLKKYPRINVLLEYYHNDFIYEKILNRTIDFGFVSHPTQKEGLYANFFAEDELVLIQCAQRPQFKRKTIPSSDLQGCRYVALSNSTPTGKEISRRIKKSGLDLQSLNEFENVETLKSAVLVGMGCAFVPRNVVSKDLLKKELQIIKLVDLSLSRPLGILFPKDKVMTRSKQKFYDCVMA